ncbi:MAG: sialidase family protein [Kofleriaceae bacterium]|nr:sialidase family protein [Kofleriaceae bacterium]
MRIVDSKISSLLLILPLVGAPIEAAAQKPPLRRPQPGPMVPAPPPQVPMQPITPKATARQALITTTIAGPNLSRSPEKDTDPHAASAGRTLYVTWRRGASIFVATSEDAGVTFRAPVEVGTTLASGRPRIAASGNEVHVVWAQAIESKAPTAAECAAQPRTRAGNILEGICLARYANVGRANPGPQSRDAIARACEREIPLGDRARDLGDAHLARNVCKGLADGKCDHGEIDVHNGPAIKNAVCRAAQDRCGALTDAGEIALCTEMASYLAIPQRATERVVYAKSTDGGRTFGAPVDISESRGAARDPAIAVDSAGGVYVAWVDSVNGDDDIYFRRIGQPKVHVLRDPNRQSEPQLVANGSNVYVSFLGAIRGEWGRDVFFAASLDRGRTVTAPEIGRSPNGDARSAFRDVGDQYNVVMYPRQGGGVHFAFETLYRHPSRRSDREHYAVLDWLEADGQQGRGSNTFGRHGDPERGSPFTSSDDPMLLGDLVPSIVANASGQVGFVYAHWAPIGAGMREICAAPPTVRAPGCLSAKPRSTRAAGNGSASLAVYVTDDGDMVMMKDLGVVGSSPIGERGVKVTQHEVVPVGDGFAVVYAGTSGGNDEIYVAPVPRWTP